MDRQHFGGLDTLLLLAVCALAAAPVAGQRPPAGRELDIVFTQLEAGPSSSAVGREPRARLVRRRPGGSVEVLSQGFFSARDPDVSFDGKRILFSGKRRPDEYWQVYEMGADGSGVRRITKEAMNCRNPIYQSTLYVITSDKPWRQISFVGSPPGQPANLYSAKLDGTAVRRITFNPYGDADPFLMPDGRMLFSGRQSHRLETGPRDRSALFGLNLDGTDYAVFSADEGAPWKRMPCVTSTRLAVFVESGKPQPGGAGTLAAVSLRRNLHSYRRLSKPSDGLYCSPSPLPGGQILVSRRPADGSGTYGIFRFDPATGKASPVYDDPRYHDIQAKLLAPRPMPDGRSSVVNEQDPNGILYCLNVYTTDFPDRRWMPPGSAKRLRVVEGLPRVGDGGNSEPPPPATRLLGEINVEPDGSFNVRVPANIPIQLQLVDQDGMALRTCSWIWVRNKEPRGCIGCHEDGELTPENRMVDALKKPSANLTLPPERRWRVTFEKNVRPIVENKCATAACHGGAGAPRLNQFNDFRRFTRATARTSPLIWRLFGRNTSRPWDREPAPASLDRMPPDGAEPLTDDERRLIIRWVDLGAE